jgi:RNA 3'-terminal phosphate cyclase (ATP)
VWDIGTAGSATMLALSVLPVLVLRGRGAEAEIRGGLFQDFAPSVFHLQHVIVPLLAQMGLTAQVEMIRPGYPPAGQGIIRLAVPACQRPLRPLAPPPRPGTRTGLEHRPGIPPG